MNALIAELVLAVPWLAVGLPILGGALGAIVLWRARDRLGRGWWRRPFAAVAAIAVAWGAPATFLVALGHMFSPSRLGSSEYAVIGFGSGALIALGGLAGYAALRVRGRSEAPLGFLLGPLLLSALPLAAAPLVRDAVGPIINAAYEEAMHARGSALAVSVDRISPTLVGGRVETVSLRITVTSDRTLSLIPSDQEIDWGLLQFRLIPPEGPTAQLATESPIGQPRLLEAGIPVTYALRFSGATGVARSPGEWTLTVFCVGDGEPYERTLPVSIIARSD